MDISLPRDTAVGTRLDFFSLFGQSPGINLPFSLGENFSANISSTDRDISSVQHSKVYNTAPESVVYAVTSPSEKAPTRSMAINGSISTANSISTASHVNPTGLNISEEADAVIACLRQIHSRMDSVQVSDLLLSLSECLFSSKLSVETADFIDAILLVQLNHCSFACYVESLIEKRGALETYLTFHPEPWTVPYFHSALKQSSGFDDCLKLMCKFTSIDSSSTTHSSNRVQDFLGKVKRLLQRSPVSEGLSESEKRTGTASRLSTTQMSWKQVSIDELYCQLCRQASANPSPNGARMVWQLMLVFIVGFAPSKRLLPSLIYYVLDARKKLLDTEKRFPSGILPFIERVGETSLRSVAASPRQALPTEAEVQAILLGENCDVQLHTLDGKVHSFAVSSFTTASQLEDMFLQSNGIECLSSLPSVSQALAFEAKKSEDYVRYSQIMTRRRQMFALYETDATTEAEYDVDGHQRTSIIPAEKSVLDVVAQWTRESSHEVARRFTLKIKYHFSFRDIGLDLQSDTDRELTRLLYWQAVRDVMSTRYPYCLQDAIVLTAIRISTESSSLELTQSGKAKKALDVKEFLSPHILSTISAEQLMAAERHILTLCRKLTHLVELDAMQCFLQYISSWKLYGAAFFDITGSNRDAHAILCISAVSVVIMDASTMIFVGEYTYDQLVSWTYSFDSVFLAFSPTPSKIKTKTHIHTSRGEEIDNLLRVYSAAAKERRTVLH